MKLLISFCILLLICSCNEAKNENTTATNESASVSDTPKNSSAAVQIILDGKPYEIKYDELRKDMVTFVNDTIQFVLWNEDYPVRLNFNLHNTGILEKGAANYTIPVAYSLSTGVIVDLNFYDSQREGKARNRRVVFKKGEIQIIQLTKNKLEMSFAGEGNGLMETSPDFPISGKVNIAY
jgi:hypothetical protein